MASRKSIKIYILKYFMAVKNSINISVLLCLLETSVGELRNGRKFKCESKSFIEFILILRRVLFLIRNLKS